MTLHTGGDAITLVDSQHCSGRQDFLYYCRSHNEQALFGRKRSLSFLTLTGYANSQRLGIDILGSMSAGESEDFHIFGIISTSATRIRGAVLNGKLVWHVECIRNRFESSLGEF